MQLGIVVTDGRYAAEAAGLLREAGERGWATRCFLTDTGVLALRDNAFNQAAAAIPGHVALCELSVERFGAALPPESLAEPIVIGGQYQNAELVHTSDRIVVF